jgi:hypothetical protein
VVSKIDEFLETGKIAHLEKLKGEVGELPAAVLSAGIPAASCAAGGKRGGAKRGGGAVPAACAPPTKAVLAKIAGAAKALESETIDGLKYLLQLNDQNKTGTKTELVERAAHQVVMGAVPRCPLCSGGRLRYIIQTGEYRCPGYQDDDKYVACGFVTAEIERLPWKTA